MSHASSGSSKRRRPHRARRTGAAARRGRSMWLKVGGAAAVLIAVSLIARAGRTSPTTHPTPRANAARARLAPPARYASYPRVAETYRMAAAVPEVLDGVFCYCYCSQHSGHYSLLDCFKGDHAAGCDVCLSEGAIAYRMTKDGKDLNAVRAAVDDMYGT